MNGSKLRTALLSLILLLMAAGSIYLKVVAQDNVVRTYLPIAARHGVLTTPVGPPITDQVTPLPTETIGPGSTPTSMPSPSGTPTNSPPTDLSPIDPPPVDPSPTDPPPVDPPPVDPPSTCEQGDESVQRARRFGVQMYTDTRPNGQYYDSLVASKAGWVRVITPWANTEPRNTTPDQYNWNWVDRELDAGNHLDVEMIGTIDFAPAWAADGPNGPIDEEAMPEFLDFVSALVERYDGDGIDDVPSGQVVTYWELYNEPDNHRYWGEAPEAYARMLEAVYPVIKAANPNAQVLFGGVAHDHFRDRGGRYVRGWADRVLQAGAGPYFDYMNFHIFALFWSERASSPPGLQEKVDEFRALMASHGVDKPIMITETGEFPMNLSEAESRKQANSLFKLLTQAAASDVKATVWWMLYDLPSAGSPFLVHAGLVTSANPPVPKLAFDAYKTVVEMLDTAGFVRQQAGQTLGNANAVAYEFADSANDRRVLSAWVDFAGSGTLRIAGQTACVHKIDGSTVSIIDSADGASDGYVTIQLGLDVIIAEVYD